MSRTVLVTFLVTSVLNFAFLAGAEAQSVGFSMRLAAANPMVQPSNPVTIFGGSLDLNFYKTYSLSVENSYSSPFRQFDNYFKQGINDISIQLNDKTIWANKRWGLNLSGRAGVLLPVSMTSRESSMRQGYTAGLALKKGFGSRYSLTYSISGDVYEHEYMTATETEESETYNTRSDLSNRISFVYNMLKTVHLQLGASLATYYLYSETFTNIYSLGSSLALDVAEGASLDIGFRTSMKDPNDPGVLVGPGAAPHFFAPEGTVVFFGTTIGI